MAIPRPRSPTSWGNQPRYGEYEIAGAGEGRPRLLGAGSFGKTFEGVRREQIAGTVIEESVAIKVLSPDLLSSASKKSQFIQELVALTRFKHSNLIHYIRCGEENGEVYYAMELCRGGDLSKLVHRYGPLPERVAALIGLQVTNGLKEVHQRHRLVHRDIKPSNIMLVDELESSLGLQHLALRIESQESLCRIVDFGLVDFTTSGDDFMPQGFKGSPMYASPEQIREQPVDGRSDIYSLGMTLWYLVQGKGPLLNARGEELRDMRESMSRHLEPREFDSDFPQHLSDGFRKILARMVAKRPEQRFGSAMELQKALEEYLKAPVPEDEPRFAVTRIYGPLETAYRIATTLPSRAGRQCYVATENVGGRAVRLVIVSDIRGSANSPETGASAKKLIEMAELTYLPSLPQAILPVCDVVHADDTLAYSEALLAQVTLAEVMRSRANLKRAMGFHEAYLILRPIAEALDFMLQRGRNSVYLPTEEIWLTSKQLDAAPDDTDALASPLNEWEELQIFFSMMFVPVSAEFGDGEQSAQETLSGSMQMSETELHPVPAFARLIYRLLNGSEVAAAAQFTPHAYVPSVSLGHGSNNLIRDILCKQHPWTGTAALLKDLCDNEGVLWKAAASSSSSKSSPARSTNRSGLSMWAGTSQTPSTAISQTRGFDQSTISRTAGLTAYPSTVAIPGVAEKICEVVSPGLVRSPYDLDGPDQAVPPNLWLAGQTIRCLTTDKPFRLPRRLDSLVASVVAPGAIQSPFDEPGRTQNIPWDDWQPGKEIVCLNTGRKMVLPLDLPLPEGILPEGVSGTVISPYDGKTAVTLAPEEWEPGAHVMCPATHWDFLLPRELPPLAAIAHAEEPGVLATPYSPAVTWGISPPDWTPGKPLSCPVTRKPLVLPDAVGAWMAEGQVSDGLQRLISNPYRPGTTLEVPPLSWHPGARVPCPVTGRSILLPAGLPPLTAEPVLDRHGEVRSPYTSEIVRLSPQEWVAGAEVRCPKTGFQFVLPTTLPEWIPDGEAVRPGFVRSPYDRHSEVPVPAAQWAAGQVVRCPATGRSFRLPSELPLLEGTVQDGRPGWVTSPFSLQAQEVTLEDWLPGTHQLCRISRRLFALPETLEEWLVDGQWVAGVPGRVRSPFPPHPELDLTADQWKPHALLTCPASGRHFRAPIQNAFSSLALEKAAVNYALEYPLLDEDQACEALSARFSAATSAQIRKIWERHELETPAKRDRAIPSGQVLPDEPGFVRSPFASHAKLTVPPAVYVRGGALITCLETGRNFRMPTGAPPLFAEAVAGKPGQLISPFEPAQPFEITPDEWTPGTVIRCPHTGHPLRLPANLPEWIIPGIVSPEEPGFAKSPFGRRTKVPVTGRDWTMGARILCPETARYFILPGNLPALTATVAAPGVVISPYDGERVIRVPQIRWKPGGQLTCPSTKRPFLLPNSLPELVIKPFPWKPVLAAAAGFAVLGAVIVILALLPHPNPGPGIDPKRPHSQGQSAIPMVVFEKGLQIEEWTKPTVPATLQLLYEGKPLKHKAEAIADSPGSFKLNAPLPVEAQNLMECAIQVKLEGWADTRLKAIVDQNGQFVLAGAIVMARKRAPLPIVIDPHGTDYSNIKAEWVRALKGEPEASLRPTEAGPPFVRVPITEDAEKRSLPTGIYKLTLEGKDPTTIHPIKPYEWPEHVTVSVETAEKIKLPVSLEGEYWGLSDTDPDTAEGEFFILTITGNVASVQLREIGMQEKPIFNEKENPPPRPEAVWQLPTEAVTLVSPGVLNFTCPYCDLPADWVFHYTSCLRYNPKTDKLEPFPRTIEVKPHLPKTSRIEELEAMRMQAIEVMKQQAVADPKKPQYTDLERYKKQLAGYGEYRHFIEKTRKTLTGFERDYKVKGFFWFTLYPTASKLQSYHYGTSRAQWDVVEDHSAPK